MLPSLPPVPRRRPPTQRRPGWRALRTAGLLAAVSGLTVVSCTDTPLTGAPPRPVTGIALSAGDATDTPQTPLGIGGSYTLSAGGIAISGVPLAPTGIVVPAGIPVRVQVSGAITRNQTAGVQEFCALPRWKDSCAGAWAPILAETPIGPSGLDYWPGAGAALVAWEGGEPTSPDSGSTSMSGTSGGELYFGRTGWGCYYIDAQEHLQGNCFTFGGGFTVTVHADGGTDTDGDGIPDALDPDDDGDGIPDEEDDDHEGEDPAALGAELVRSVPVGESTDAMVVARYREGASVAGFRWSFVPDVVTSVSGDTVPEMEMAMVAATMRSDLPPGIERVDATHVRLPDGRIVGSGLHIYQIPAAGKTRVAADRTVGPTSEATPLLAMSTTSSATGAIALSECNSVSSCSALVPATSGTFLVTAFVDGKPRSASARLGAVAPPAAPTVQLTCTPLAVRGQTVRCRAAMSSEVPFTIRDVQATLNVGAMSYSPHAGGAVAAGREYVLEGPAVTFTELTLHADFEWSGKPSSQAARASFRVDPRPRELDEYVLTQGPLPAGDEGTEDWPLPFKKNTLGLYVREDPDWGKVEVTTVASGPNRGLTYVLSVPGLPAPDIMVSRGLFPGFPWYDAHPTTPGERDPYGRLICTQSQLDQVRLFVERHEGLTLADNSHYGIDQRSLRLWKIGREFGRTHGLYTGSAAQVRQQVIMRISAVYDQEEAYQAGEQAAFDKAEGNAADAFSCGLFLNRDF